MTLPLAPYTLRAHANSQTERVRAIRFAVNLIELAAVNTETSAGLAYAEFAWSPSVPGEYQIEAIAEAESGAKSEPVMVPVCVEATRGSGCPRALSPVMVLGTVEPGEISIPPTATPTAAGFTGGGIGVIEGAVLADLTEDGDANDAGEGPLQGVTVSVSGCASDSMVTGPDGAYGFKVPPGDCQLQAGGGAWFFISAQPSGATYPVPVSVALNASSWVTMYLYNKEAADLAAVTPQTSAGIGVIEGAVMADLNEDGDANDVGEGPLQGVVVTVSGCASESLASGPEGEFGFKVAPAAPASSRSTAASGTSSPPGPPGRRTRCRFRWLRTPIRG